MIFQNKYKRKTPFNCSIDSTKKPLINSLSSAKMLTIVPFCQVSSRLHFYLLALPKSQLIVLIAAYKVVSNSNTIIYFNFEAAYQKYKAYMK